MVENRPHRIALNFPGDLEYIAAVRKLVSEMLVVNGFSQKFAYRSEVIVDETCTNAVRYGCQTAGAEVAFECLIWPDRVEMNVKDPGGNKGDVARLRETIDAATASPTKLAEAANGGRGGLGLEIVRMLSKSVEVSIDENNLTSIRVVRLREENAE